MSPHYNQIQMGNILVISDTHEPFCRKGYLQFCLKQKKKYKCDIVVHVGDLVDNHAISYHDHDPDGLSPKDEYELAKKKLRNWFVAFPKVYLCKGNHDRMIDRKGKTEGLPEEFFRPFREIWELPDGWIDGFEFEFNGVLFKHGINCGGKNGHLNAAINERQSTVIGHNHIYAGVDWDATHKDCIFGMSVGRGIDKDAYAFAYGRDFKKRPIIGCGVVFSATNAMFIPMDL